MLIWFFILLLWLYIIYYIIIIPMLYKNLKVKELYMNKYKKIYIYIKNIYKNLDMNIIKPNIKQEIVKTIYKRFL